MSSDMSGTVRTPPAFEVPDGACDCHTHVFGPPAEFPFAPGRVYTPPEAPLEGLLELQRDLDLERVVIVQPSVYGTDNSCTIDALERLGGRGRGVAVIDPAIDDAALVAMHRAGVRGVRLNLSTAGVRDPAAARRLLGEAAARVAPLRWHVQTYTSLAVIDALADELAALPVPLVVDHFGGARAEEGTSQPGFGALLALLRAGRAYVKLSAPYRVSRRADHADVAPLARALIEANPERCLWGSDWPHPGGGERKGAPRLDEIEPFWSVDDGRNFNLLADWAPDPDVRRRLLVDNPAILYGF